MLYIIYHGTWNSTDDGQQFATTCQTQYATHSLRNRIIQLNLIIPICVLILFLLLSVSSWCSYCSYRTLLESSVIWILPIFLGTSSSSVTDKNQLGVRAGYLVLYPVQCQAPNKYQITTSPYYNYRTNGGLEC